jgi:hypothetical protein
VHGKAHGRGILIWNNGCITIGYFKDDKGSNGNLITIISYGRNFQVGKVFYGGNFQVGEIYFKDGVKWSRGTQYNSDGTEEKFDFDN